MLNLSLVQVSTLLLLLIFTGNDFVCELGPSRNVYGASLDKDNEIEELKQSSKGK